MFSCLRELSARVSRLVAVAAVVAFFHLTVAVAISVALKMGSIQRRRESVGRFEISDEVALVIQSDLECDLFHTQET